MHNGPVTCVDMHGAHEWTEDSGLGHSTAASTGLGTGVSQAVPSKANGSLREGPVNCCLALSGSIDHSICVYRAAFGKGLQLLRRCTAPYPPRSVLGALIVHLPAAVGTISGGGNRSGEVTKAHVLLG